MSNVDKNLLLKIVIFGGITFAVGLILLLLGLNIWFNEFFYDNEIVYVIFRIFTDLGDTIAYIILIVVVFYAYDKVVGKNLAYSLFGSYFVNSILKDIFQDPRPWTNIRNGNPVEKGFGFPSGHAQQATATYGYLAYEAYRKENKIVFWIFTILVFIIASSRVIIGVHDLQDVWGGLTFGFIWIIFFIALEPKISAKVNELSFLVKIILSLVVPIVIFIAVMLMFPTTLIDYGMVSGAMMGLSLGYVFEEEKIKYDPRNLTINQRVINLAVGLVLTLILYLALSFLFPRSEIIVVSQTLYFIRYSILSFLLVGIVPWIFIKINRK